MVKTEMAIGDLAEVAVAAVAGKSRDDRAAEADQSAARGSGGSSSQTRTEDPKDVQLPATAKRSLNATRWGAEKGSSAKRKKTGGKGSDKPWYCCSCKQSLAPKDFDPGLETCRVCLAKRRAKDRAKKRLRGLQLKHHLLSADEKDVAAFLLGVYHPAIDRGAIDQSPETPGSAQHTIDSMQRHCQASVEVNAFVEDFQSFLEGQPEVEAVQLIRTFLGVDEHGRKLPPPDESELNELKKKSTKSKYGYGKKVPVEARKEMEVKLDVVYKKYSSMLARVDDQTWVRFAAVGESQSDEKLDVDEAKAQETVKYSEPIHRAEQEGFHGESGDAGAIADIYSSMLNSADPTVNHFLYEFLFSTDSEPQHMHSEQEDMPVSSDSAFFEEVGEVECNDDLQVFDEQLDGDAYAFKGSLVMGWIGGARGVKRELLSSGNGILPDDLRPQALSRGGQLFDARNPGSLVPLEETLNLHGFAPDLEVYPVIDSSTTKPPVINIPSHAYSGELGVRALHNGHYIDCDIRQKSDGSTDVILYPNGKEGKNPGPVVILGAVHLQCFVRTGTAKLLPIGSNIPVLMIPSQGHVDEIKRGVHAILVAKGPMEARQFLISLAHVLQHIDPKSSKFKFVLEMACILQLTKTLKLLERLSTLAKASSDEETTAIASAHGHAAAAVGPLTEVLYSATTMIGRPLLCLVAGLIRTTSSHLDGNYYRSLALLMIAALTGVSPKTRIELKTLAFSFLFSVAHLLTFIAYPSAERQSLSYVTGLIITYALSLLHATHSNLSIFFSVVVPHIVFAAFGFSPSFLQKSMIRGLPGLLDAYSRVMLTVHASVAHALFSVVMPISLARFMRRLVAPPAIPTTKHKVT